jgi:hypothetical protein
MKDVLQQTRRYWISRERSRAIMRVRVLVVSANTDRRNRKDDLSTGLGIPRVSGSTRRAGEFQNDGCASNVLKARLCTGTSAIGLIRSSSSTTTNGTSGGDDHGGTNVFVFVCMGAVLDASSTRLSLIVKSESKTPKNLEIRESSSSGFLWSNESNFQIAVQLALLYSYRPVDS